MARSPSFSERIGAVHLPEADTIPVDEATTLADDPAPFPAPPAAPIPGTLPRICRTRLKRGLLHAEPRAERHLDLRHPLPGHPARRAADRRPPHVRRPLQLPAARRPRPAAARLGPAPARAGASGARLRRGGRHGGTIPIYPRRSYLSVPEGHRARALLHRRPARSAARSRWSSTSSSTHHPATGFSGSFDTTRRPRRCGSCWQAPSTPDLFTGDAFVRTRRSSGRCRSAGSPTLPARRTCSSTRCRAPPRRSRTAATSSPASSRTPAGTLTVTDGGTVPLPAGAGRHQRQRVLVGGQPAHADELGARLQPRRPRLGRGGSHLVCRAGHGSSCSPRRHVRLLAGGADPNAVRREGSATFSHDGYPASDVPTSGADRTTTAPPTSSSATCRARSCARPRTRSGTRSTRSTRTSRAGNDNSIMSPTPGVAAMLGVGGTFPDEINLAFNDHGQAASAAPARPGGAPGRDGLLRQRHRRARRRRTSRGSDAAELSLKLSSRPSRPRRARRAHVRADERGRCPLPVPESLDVESLTVRINVTDPTGRITFMRPAAWTRAHEPTIEALEPRRRSAARRRCSGDATASPSRRPAGTSSR